MISQLSFAQCDRASRACMQCHQQVAWTAEIQPHPAAQRLQKASRGSRKHSRRSSSSVQLSSSQLLGKGRADPYYPAAPSSYKQQASPAAPAKAPPWLRESDAAPAYALKAPLQIPSRSSRDPFQKQQQTTPKQPAPSAQRLHSSSLQRL